MDPAITCPACGHRFALTASLAAPLLEPLTRAAEARAQSAAAAMLAEKTREATDLAAQLRARDAKLAEAQKTQADLLRQQRELADQKRELDLTVERGIAAALAPLRDKAKLEAEEAAALKLREKDLQLDSMKKQIDELSRKAEQGSQQRQGEALELELEALLRTRFPRDDIVPVPKGEHGGDVLHHVHGAGGQRIGTILWEAKRTKNWSDPWLPKLRQDQRGARADIAVMVSQAVPKGLRHFDQIDGIWVVEPGCVAAIGTVLRHALQEAAAARAVSDNQQTKSEQIYAYVTSPRFRHRVGAIVEKFQSMQDDLERERLMAQKLWAKREAQIRGVLEATAGLYGDLQGIAGSSIPEIAALDMKLLEGG